MKTEKSKTFDKKGLSHYILHKMPEILVFFNVLCAKSAEYQEVYNNTINNYLSLSHLDV
jgi:hypothetical protein